MKEPDLYRRSDVDALGHPGLWQRIQNKPIGGCASDNGFRMEHFFAVYKLIEIGAEIIGDEQRNPDIADDADMTKYLRCLVDDLRVRNQGQTTFYQSKWGRVPLKEVLTDIDLQSKLDHATTNVTYKVLVRTPRRVTILTNLAAAAGVPLIAEQFSFAVKWRRFSDVNPHLALAMIRLAGNSNENRYEALFNAISAKWLAEDDIFIRQFIFEIWQEYRTLFHDREFPAALTPLDVNARAFEVGLKALGFRVVMHPQIHVGLGTLSWDPIDTCDEEFFAEFMKWFDISHRSNGEIMIKLWEMAK